MKAIIDYKVKNILHYVDAHDVSIVELDVHIKLNDPDMVGKLAKGCAEWGLDFKVHFTQSEAEVTIPFGAKYI